MLTTCAPIQKIDATLTAPRSARRAMTTELPDGIKNLLNVEIEFALKDFKEEMGMTKIKLKKDVFAKKYILFTMRDGHAFDEYTTQMIAYVKKQCDRVREAMRRNIGYTADPPTMSMHLSFYANQKTRTIVEFIMTPYVIIHPQNVSVKVPIRLEDCPEFP
jgi:hypothetical protein